MMDVALCGAKSESVAANFVILLLMMNFQFAYCSFQETPIAPLKEPTQKKIPILFFVSKTNSLKYS